MLAAIDDLVRRSANALDVGAGFGALALPLARRVAGVTALEPAPAMAEPSATARPARGSATSR